MPEEKEDTFNYTLFLGFVGLCNVVLFIPFTLFLHYSEFETLEWPEKTTWILLVLNAFVGTFISDYCWGKSVILLGPFVTTLGITVTFPLSAIFDTLVNGAKFTWLYFLGSILIFTAFGVIMTAEWLRKRKKDQNQSTEEKEIPTEDLPD